jgi:hypothetical protein
MDHRQTIRRRTGALWLLVLALVSVLAPVFADTYVCPMAKAARVHLAPCCARNATAMPATPIPGRPQMQVPCDCPKLSWTADVNDQVSELRAGSDNTVALGELPAALVLIHTPVRFVPRAIDRQTARSSPPLWLRNLSILC